MNDSGTGGDSEFGEGDRPRGDDIFGELGIGL